MISQTPPNHYFIAVAGIMGVGKTTAARILGQHFSAHVFEEEAGRNVFLPHFYKDMKRWALNTQLWYLTQKIRQYLKAQDALFEASIIQDVPIEQDAEVYARLQYRLGNLSEREHRLYRELYELYRPQLPVPDLVVFLDASPQFLHHRIRQRGVAFEQNVSEEYLSILQRMLDEWKAKHSISPILTFPLDEMDILENPQNQESFIQRIIDALGK